MRDPPRTSNLFEPKGLNTVLAIALSALAVAEAHGPDTVMFVLPADHIIPDISAFVANALETARHAQLGQLVVFGIQPTVPETGFGYIEVAKVTANPQPVLNFVEKPDHSRAMGCLATGRYYWYSGMFRFTASAMLDALVQHAPEVLLAAKQTMASANTGESQGRTHQVTRFDIDTFALQPDTSIDYTMVKFVFLTLR